MKNKCKVCGSNAESEYCWKHKPKKGLERGVLKKGKWNKAKTKEGGQKLWEFFLEIWGERPHYSEVSGAYLGEEPKTYMFEHLLERNKYPELTFEKDNIALVTLMEHDAKNIAHPLPKHQELIQKAKIKFGIT